MIAHIELTNQTISGRTLKDIRAALIHRMKVLDLRGLTAITETGATVHVEVYEGQDYIILKNGRILK